MVIIGIVISTVLGSSAPDLDTPTSGLWSKVPVGRTIGHVVHPIFLGGHRHLSHSIIGFGLFILLFNFLLHLILPATSAPNLVNYQANNLYLLAFGIGIVSHLLADMFTEAGVPLLFPLGYHFGIPPNPFEKIRIKTGRWFENLIVYPAVNLALIYTLWQYFFKK